MASNNRLRKKNKKDVIFISNEKKEDWWNKKDNLILGIRTELLREFASKTNNQKFHIYNADKFLEYAKKYESVSISASVRKEVKENIENIENLDIEDIIERFTIPKEWVKLVKMSQDINEISDSIAKHTEPLASIFRKYNKLYPQVRIKSPPYIATLETIKPILDNKAEDSQPDSKQSESTNHINKDN